MGTLKTGYRPLLELVDTVLGVVPNCDLSVRATHIGPHCSVNAVMTFVYARNGLELRRFDPLLWPDEQRVLLVPV